jgi:predicted  nucleic acid-binding Zn-ribbon protein
MTMKELFKKGKEAVGKAASSTGEFVSDVSDSTSKMYNESKVKEGVDYVSDGTSNQLDVISGQKMYDLVQEKIELQNSVNDVLAHKLHEALNRIEKLEEEIKTLKS